MFSPQRRADRLLSARHLLLTSSCSLGDKHCVEIIVEGVWYASVLHVLSLRLGGRGCGSAGVAGGAASGGSEPERPSGVSSLTTGRTPEPLNPGLHSVRSAAPWDSSRGALTAPVFWLDPRHSLSRAVHDDSLRPPVLPRLHQDHKYSPERVSVCSCFLRCLWPSHSFMLSSLAANKHTRTHADTFKAPKKNTCDLTSADAYIRSVRTDGLVTRN